MFGRKVIQIEAAVKVQWRVAQDPESGEYIGICDALNLNAAGDNWAEFLASASEAIEVLFDDLFHDDEVEGFLREHGWRMRGKLPRSGKPRFEVPFDIEQHPFQELMAARA